MPANRQKGASLVETAFTLTVLVFTVFWIVELSLMIYDYNVMADAAKEGVRYAVVHGSRNTSSTGPASLPTGTATCSTNTGPVYSKVQEFAGMSLHDRSSMS